MSLWNFRVLGVQIVNVNNLFSPVRRNQNLAASVSHQRGDITAQDRNPEPSLGIGRPGTKDPKIFFDRLGLRMMMIQG
jgi:hypothetical protein